MKTAVLLINLGSPQSCDPKDVKKYLIEFLLDPKVIDLPWLTRQLLVRGVIVPKRYHESAKLYQSVWTKEGSPLISYAKQVKNKLQNELGDSYIVDIAMRYQQYKIEDQIENLLAQGIKKMIFVPLFPQYAEATTGSILNEITKVLKKKKFFPEFSFISHYETQEKMIQAFCENINTFDLDQYDHILFSFHGLPIRHLKKLNVGCYGMDNCCERKQAIGCYKKQCQSTADAIIDRLRLSKEKTGVSFQSRLGKEVWIQPYTFEESEKLLKQGKKKILVVCPAFVADCLETLSEIGIEYREAFMALGGEKYDLVPSLNDHQTWIEALKELVLSGS
jgi:ferrochelatase